MKETKLPTPRAYGKSSIVRRRLLEPSLYILAALVALLRLSDAIYLAVEHLTGQNVECLASGGCETVLMSSHAAAGKVPLVAFGAAAYFAVF